jgi:hypothetical protein
MGISALGMFDLAQGDGMGWHAIIAAGSGATPHPILAALTE